MRYVLLRAMRRAASVGRAGLKTGIPGLHKGRLHEGRRLLWMGGRMVKSGWERYISSRVVMGWVEVERYQER